MNKFQKDYTKYVAKSLISKCITVVVPHPNTKEDILFRPGPKVTEEVSLTIKEVQNISIVIDLTFGEYKREFRFYTPFSKSPSTLYGELYNKISTIVHDTYIEDGKEDYLINLYREMRDTYVEEILKGIKESKDVETLLTEIKTSIDE